MNLKVYNTLTKEKENFIPSEEGKVKIYVCGVTPIIIRTSAMPVPLSYGM